MRNKRKLLIEQLDNKLKAFSGTDKVQIPEKGWIRTIRASLNMTLDQLGYRLNITKQGVRGLEKSEEKGSISVNSLKEVAAALESRLVYAFVPNDKSYEQLVYKKAEMLARKIIMRTHQNMVLEDQGVDESSLQKAIEELTAELQREMKRALWD